MLAKLAELAARSKELRDASFEKEAFLGTAARVAMKAGRLAVKNPGAALGVGLTAAMAPGAAKSSWQKYQTGFDPDVQQQMLGPAPGAARLP